jgi:hypothetical protein
LTTDDRADRAEPSRSLSEQRLLDQIVGVARLATAVIDRYGRVTHWSRVAQEVFGIPPADAMGHSFTDLLRPSNEHRVMFEPGQILQPWQGSVVFTQVRCGVEREVLCWLYALNGPGDAWRLLIAADAERLREDGPGVAVDDMIVVSPGRTGRRTIAPGANVLRVEPVATVVPPGRERYLGRRIADTLPRMGPEASEEIVRQVLRCGYPAVHLSVSFRFPVVPSWGMPRLLGVRPSLAQTAESPIAGPVAAAPPDDDAAGDSADLPAERRPEPAESPERLSAAEWLSFLNEASAHIGSTLDLRRTVDELCEVLVPRFADFAGVQLLLAVTRGEEIRPHTVSESTVLQRVAVRHDDEPGRWDDVVPVGEVLRLPADTPFVQCMTTGRPVNIARIGEELSNEIASHFDNRDLRPLLNGRSLLIVPLIARGRVLGNLVLLRKNDRPPFDGLDAATAAELVARATVCIDNARLYGIEATAARKLQISMLPSEPPTVVGVEVANRYLQGAKGIDVGGDWYDVISLAGSRVALVVGDVMGHGLHAASIMGQFRTALRTLASIDLPPEQVLRHLDDLAQRLGELYLAQPDIESHIATCVYVVYDPVTRRVEVANAGHIPPVLIHPDGHSELLDLPPGAPIGVGGVAFETVELPMPDRSQLLLCTDGLVEHRGADIDIGLAVLRAKVAGPARSPEEICESVIHALWTPDRRDDVALLVARFEGIDDTDVVSWTLQPDPRVARQARRNCRAALEKWDLERMSEPVELIVGELVTNAIQHGSGTIGLRLLRLLHTNRLLCEVHDTDHALPLLIAAGDQDESGRGMQIVSRLAERWGTSRTSTGKVVWFEYPVPMYEPPA